MGVLGRVEVICKCMEEQTKGRDRACGIDYWLAIT